MPKSAKRMARKAIAKTKRTEPQILGEKDTKVLTDLAAAEVSTGFWKPSVEGDAVIGTLLSAEKTKGRWGPQTVLTIGTRDGSVTVYCNKTLETGIVASGVKIGDKLGIMFKGSLNVGKGRPMNLFAVRRLTGGRKGGRKG